MWSVSLLFFDTFTFHFQMQIAEGLMSECIKMHLVTGLIGELMVLPSPISWLGTGSALTPPPPPVYSVS